MKFSARIGRRIAAGLSLAGAIVAVPIAANTSVWLGLPGDVCSRNATR
ncbi:MAG: hypothetical protein ACYCVZ_11355 [Streptosporangiaceae bacterium]